MPSAGSLLDPASPSLPAQKIKVGCDLNAIELPVFPKPSLAAAVELAILSAEKEGGAGQQI